jgi:hypothetical protein
VTIYAGAIPVTSVVCPSWCTLTQQEHLEQLDNLEGRCIHYSFEVTARHWSVDHSSDTYVDGTPDPKDPPIVHLHSSSEGLSVDQAEAFARAILAAVEVARS